ncbi:NAD(P)-dependent oxidoreductase [Nocardia sp. NPDC052566]|uniref:NAD(P)-dependent oxidoreductase n=1 Tax=Nocardia sp. NPDC052566 TaxID=3364330 RepID=UPI0037C9F275
MAQGRRRQRAGGHSGVDLRAVPRRRQVNRRSVTVIGLGPMGMAMVEAFLAAGVEVTVWNRSAEKAVAAVALGAMRADSVAAALDANELTVVVLTHYAAMHEVLGQAPDHLAGKVIVNMSSDSPANTRAAAAWITAQGGRFLAGGVMAQSHGLALPGSYVFYSGPAEVFEAGKELLRSLTPYEYLGEDTGLAQLYYQAVLAIFNPLLLGFEQALALIVRSGDDIDRFLPYAQRSMGRLDEVYAGFAAAAKAGGWGDLANLRMMEAGARHVVETGTAIGVDSALARTVQDYWRRAVAASERAGRAVPVHEVFTGAVPASSAR